MTPTLLGVRRAPGPVRRLDQRLAAAGTPLVEYAVREAGPHVHLHRADTPIGTISVWRNGQFWGAELAPSGMSVFVDSGVWRACQRGTPLGFGRPSIGRQVAWLEKLLDQGLPAFDRNCLLVKAAQRARQSEPPTGRRLVAIIALAVVTYGLLMWAAVVLDQPGLRIVISAGVAGLAITLLAPYADRFQKRRTRRRAQRVR